MATTQNKEDFVRKLSVSSLASFIEKENIDIQKDTWTKEEAWKIASYMFIAWWACCELAQEQWLFQSQITND